MKLRTKLILGFVLLSIIPLSGLTVYSYLNSLSSFRQLVEDESALMADDMEGRMDRMALDLGRRLEGMRRYGYRSLMPDPEQEGNWQPRANEFYSDFVARMGDRAPFIRSLEFMPMMRGGSGETQLAGETDVDLESRSRAEAEPVAPVAPTSPVPSAFVGSDGEVQPIVIDLAEMNVVVTADGAGTGQAVTFVHKGNRIEVHRAAKNAVAAAAEIEKSIQKLDRIAGSIERKTEQLQMKTEVEESHDTDERINELQNRRAAVEAKREKLEFMLMLDLDKMALGGEEAKSHVRARVDAGDMVNDLLSRLSRREDEIPFVIDEDGQLFTPDPDDMAALEALNLNPEGDGHGPSPTDWVVVTREQQFSGVRVGIARPIAKGLGDIRNAAVQNLGYGFGMVALALLGIVPLSSRMTRNLSKVTSGAEQLAKGDWKVRVPAASRDEIGQLGRAFNKMARDLQTHQEELVQQERIRNELEIGRQIQEELLPQRPLKLPFAEIQGVSIPAREVGGDFFNYFTLPDGRIALLIADVSGKGVGAALLMANLQARLSARLTSDANLAELAHAMDVDLAAQTPPSTFVTLFAAILDGEMLSLRWVNAGHNTQYVATPGHEPAPLRSSGRPLGLLPGAGYTEERIALHRGDSLFLYTDGLVEAENKQGSEFGEARLEALLTQTSLDGPQATLLRIEAASRAHRQGREAGDDATMMVLRVS